MPSLSLLATSPPLLSAALAVVTPLPQEQPVIAPATALVWTLADQPTTPSTPPAQSENPPAPAEGTPPGEAPAGEIVVEGTYGPPASDPAEQINAESYRITQAVDQALVEPMAHAYRDSLPEPIRDGLGNVVRNLGEPSNALNFLLQGKVGKAFETLGRLAVNSTLGVGGLFDVAGKSKIDLPYRRNGFANTLGFYGVGPGPYLYLPVIGATTVRDLAGRTLDQLLLPVLVGEPFAGLDYGIPYFVVNGLDQRLEFDEELAKIRTSDDPYGMRRDTYLAQRRKDIAALKGEVVEDDQAAVEADAGPDEAAEETAPPAASTPAPPPDPALTERVQITAGAGLLVEGR